LLVFFGGCLGVLKLVCLQGGCREGFVPFFLGGSGCWGVVALVGGLSQIFGVLVGRCGGVAWRDFFWGADY